MPAGGGLAADGVRPPQALWGEPVETRMTRHSYRRTIDMVGGEASDARRWGLKTDHWFYGLFQSAPDLIALLLPATGAAGASAVPSLGPDSPGDALYRYCFAEALRL